MTASPQQAESNAESAQLRAAHIDDVAQIAVLLKIYSDNGKLLPRPESDLFRTFREFVVLQTNDKIVGCAALQIFTRNLGEVRSLAVDPDHSGRRYGSIMLQRIEQQAQEVGLQRLMALTYVEGFFHRHGYATVNKETLPEKVWGVCINCHKFLNCDEIAVLKVL